MSPINVKYLYVSFVFLFMCFPIGYATSNRENISLTGMNYDFLFNKLSSILPFEINRHRNRFNFPDLDPEVYMNVTQLITSKGYPCENHIVQTQDGFLLGVQRIPHGKGGKAQNSVPVFLQHGLLCASTNWVTNLVNESLGFLLADAGYDVWLGNVRGNTYSMQNVKLEPCTDAFWAWSFDQMGQYDLPAMVDYVLAKTGQTQLYYIGHSQGSTMAFAELSKNPSLNQKIKTFIALAPVTKVAHTKSPVKLLADLPDRLLYGLFGRRDFLPNNEVIKFLAEYVCPYKYLQSICANVLFLLAGPDLTNFNETRMPVYLAHAPAGTSTQDLVHWMQLMRSDKFCMYDYGSVVENMKHYGQPTPPDYIVENISTPTYIFWADNDWLADPTDVAALLPRVKNLVGNLRIADMNHLDFIWGMNARTIVYDKIIQIIQQTEEKY